MLNVEIRDENITSTTRGNFTFHEQTAYVTLIDSNGNPFEYPERITLQHPAPAEGQQVQPHKKGLYELAPQSFYKNGYNNLKLGRIILKPVVAEQRKTA